MTTPEKIARAAAALDRLFAAWRSDHEERIAALEARRPARQPAAAAAAG